MIMGKTSLNINVITNTLVPIQVSITLIATGFRRQDESGSRPLQVDCFVNVSKVSLFINVHRLLTTVRF